MNTLAHNHAPVRCGGLRPLLAGLVGALLVSLPLLADAGDQSTPAEATIARALAVTGQVPVKAVGPYIEIGSYRIWVTAHLGRPDAKLPDGTLLYADRQLDGMDVKGTLVVFFTNGRVSDMRLVTPQVATAMLNSAQPAPNEAVAAIPQSGRN